MLGLSEWELARLGALLGFALLVLPGALAARGRRGRNLLLWLGIGAAIWAAYMLYHGA